MTASGSTPLPAPGRRIIGVVDDYVAVLDELEDRVDANTTTMLRRSLENVLADLRRAYSNYINAVGPTGFDPEGTPIRRPGAYSAGEAATKFRAIQEQAAGFLPPEEIQSWAARFADDLAEATNLGGEVAATLQQIVTRAPAQVPFAGADPFAVRAATEISSAFIQGEGARFRDQIVQTVGEGVSRGWGPKRLERQIREALEGATDPDGLTQHLGLRQRAALIARSELANAYAKGSLDHALSEGFGYVRWIAASDERTCPTCASRNGRIFPADRVAAPAHPRCRCVLAPVPTEAVEEPDPVLRDRLLDNEFWRDEYQAGVEAYAKAKGVSAAKAETQLSRALQVPTASERRLFPNRTKPLPPSVALDAPKDGRTFEEAIRDRAGSR